ncbi:hypothetical protein D3C71_1625110 [compost metagenome]
MTKESFEKWTQRKNEIEDILNARAMAENLNPEKGKLKVVDNTLKILIEIRAKYTLIKTKIIEVGFHLTQVPANNKIITVEVNHGDDRIYLHIDDKVASNNILKIVEFFELEDYDGAEFHNLYVENKEDLMLLLSKLKI